MEGKLTISDFTGLTKSSGSQVVYQHCPVCGASTWKTYLNPDTGFWYCHASGHSGGGCVDVGQPLANRGRLLLDQLHAKSNLDVSWKECHLPSWEPLSKRAKRYLAKRGISETRATSLGIVEMEDRMRVVVPYSGPDGNIIYWTARSYSKMEEGPKYMAASGRHPLYVRPNWTATKTIVVVEGVFDAIAVEKHTGHTAVAMGGKSLPRYLEPDLLRVGTDRLLLMLDPDALGNALKLRQRLMTKRQIVIIPLPMGNDPADLQEKLKGLIP